MHEYGPSSKRRPATQPEVFLTIAELASRWRCSKRHVQRIIAKGELPVHRLGDRHVRISLWDVSAYEAQRRHNA